MSRLIFPSEMHLAFPYKHDDDDEEEKKISTKGLKLTLLQLMLNLTYKGQQAQC